MRSVYFLLVPKGLETFVYLLYSFISVLAFILLALRFLILQPFFIHRLSHSWMGFPSTSCYILYISRVISDRQQFYNIFDFLFTMLTYLLIITNIFYIYLFYYFIAYGCFTNDFISTTFPAYILLIHSTSKGIDVGRENPLILYEGQMRYSWVSYCQLQ